MEKTQVMSGGAVSLDKTLMQEIEAQKAEWDAKWIKQFNANYNGQSDEAKELKDKSKANYKGNVYIPWAVIERMTYQQDPRAYFTKIQNNNGGFVHTDIVEIHSIIDGKETLVQSMAHFVRIGLFFLGKYFEETYPIQDQAYNAPKVFDQNQVNKAMQRGLAKVASRGTGLALTLYEGGDLQFEDDTTPVVTAEALVAKKKPITEKTKEALEDLKVAVRVQPTGKELDEDAKSRHVGQDPEETPSNPEPVKATRKTAVKREPEPVVAPVEEEEEASTLSEAFVEAITKIIMLLKDDAKADKITSALRSFNKSFLTSYGFTLSREESVTELGSKLAKITDPTKFLASLERMCK